MTKKRKTDSYYHKKKYWFTKLKWSCQSSLLCSHRPYGLEKMNIEKTLNLPEQKRLIRAIYSGGESCFNMVAGCLRELIKGINFPRWGDNMFEKLNKVEQIPMVKRDNVWVKCSNWSTISWVSREYFRVECWSSPWKEQELRKAQWL